MIQLTTALSLSRLFLVSCWSIYCVSTLDDDDDEVELVARRNSTRHMVSCSKARVTPVENSQSLEILLENVRLQNCLKGIQGYCLSGLSDL